MKNNYLSKSRWLLLLFALIVGIGSAWATKTDNGNGTFTEDFAGSLPDGWVLHGSLSHDTDRARSGKCLVATGTNIKTDYVVTPKLVGGSKLSFYARPYNKSYAGYIGIYAVDASGNLTGEKLGEISMTKTNSPGYAAFELTVPTGNQRVALDFYYAAMDDVTYTPVPVTLGVYTDSEATAAVQNGVNLDFGFVTTAGSQTYYIKNQSAADWDNLAIGHTGNAVLSDVSANLAKDGIASFTITQAASGTTSDVVTITAGTDQEFTINVSGTIKDPNKVYLDFSDGKIPEGWSSVAIGSWASGYGSPWAASTGYISQSGISSSYEWAFTSPTMIFTEGETVLFETAKYGSSGSYTPSIKVQYSTDGSSWTAIGSAFTDDTYGNWTTRSVVIPTADAKYIRFSGWYIHMRNIYGGQLPVEPRNLAISKSGTSATLTWTTNGTETDWQVYTSTTASDIEGEITPINVSTTPSYTFTGLAVNTTHYAWVRSKLSDTPTYSDWKQISFYLGYAAATPGSVDGNGISNVSFGTGTEVVNYNTSKSPYYQDNSAQVGGVAAGTTANVDITYATGYGYGTVIWVDWNQNYEFEETEVVYKGQSGSSNPTTLNASFDISISQPVGSYRMRIAGADSYFNTFISGGAYNASYSNVNSLYAVAQDYTLKVNEAPSVMAPTTLKKNSVTATTVNLGWTENGDATAWQIALGTTSEFDPDDVTPIEANANPFTVIGLTQETTYYAYVRAKKGGDTSDWSNKIDFTTPNAKPSSVVVAAGDNYATFSWTANAGETAWQIKYSTTSEFDPVSEGTLQAVTTNPYTLSGLTPETTYYAYLRADLGGGEYSDWTAKQTFTPGFSHVLTVNEGNGTTTSGSVPFYGSYTDDADRGWSQFIIPASQIGSMNGGNINKISFYTTSSTTWNNDVNPTFKVYLKEVDNETFASKEFIDWASMTEIFDGEIEFDGSQLNINLATPYAYTGKNLMVGFYQTVAGGWCNTSWVGTSAANEVGVQNASGATTYNWAAFLPKTTFSYETVTGPRLAVSTDAIDFGELNQSSTAEDKQKTFTISNTGVQELTGLSVEVAGAGYSVSALPRTNITTTGENSAAIELTVTLAPTTSGIYDGTVTVSATGMPNKVINLTATYVADPLMGVFNDDLASEAATTGQTVNFGYVEAAPTYTYYIKNTGAGTLDIAVTDGGLTVSPANASLAAGEQQAFTITANVANADATVTFAGTNHDGGAAIGSFTVTLQGTVMPLTSTYFEGFAYAAGDETPDATTTELPGWEINNNTNTVKFFHSTIYYYASSTETASLITPKLRVAGTTDVLRFGAYTAYTYSSSKLIISYSADKINWTVATTKTGDVNFGGETYVTKAFELSGIPEGSYYFKIEMCDVAVDYFYGFSSTLPSIMELSETEAPSLVTGIRDVTLNRTFNDGWNTVCLPFAVNDVEGVFGAGAYAYSFTGYDAGNLTFEKVTSLTAATPYLVYVPSGFNSKALYNVTLSDDAAGEVTNGGITFRGSYAPVAAGDWTKYDASDIIYGVTSAGKIAKAGATASIKGFRAYFDVPAGASVKGMSLFDGDDATSINGIALEGMEEGQLYDLSGRRVNPATTRLNGIYILNGKKVLFK